MNREHLHIQAAWKTIDESPREIGDTYADLTIDVNGWVASRNYDSSSMYMRDYAAVSAYPLALWLAFYWWRVIYEPCPSKWYYKGLSYNWRNAHELTASGNGFIWPPLRFIPNGERILILLQPASKPSPSNAQYEIEGRASIERGAVEKGLYDFVNNTVEHLEIMGHRDTELQKLWPEVEKERNDPDSNLYRILEASLGFNPDEGPDELIDTLADKTEIAGVQPIFEIAAACSVEAVANPNDAVAGIVNANGQGKPAMFNYGGFHPDAVDLRRDKPWVAGRVMAKRLRRHLGFNNNPIDNTGMASLFELPAKVLEEDEISIENLSLGVPDESNPDRLKVYFHQKHVTGRRFYLARLLGERLLNSEQPANWLPATFGLTWRQKYQRAFASEFLCPFQVLDERVRTAAPDDDIFAPLAEEYIMDANRLEKHWEHNRSDRDGGLLSV